MVPCHNEEEALPLFLSELSAVLLPLKQSTEGLSCELLLVDDGSSDNTLAIMKRLDESDFPGDIRWISLSRNFGKEAAIYAGLENSKGDYVVVMDADMQDPPSLIPDMLDKLMHDGFDCVATRRSTRKGEPLIRSFFAKLFYKMINRMSDVEIVDGARDFRMMKRAMVDAVLSVGEYNRFSKGVFSWVGFKTYWMKFENVERVAGKTKWSFWGLVAYSIDAITSFSMVPLSMASIVGFLFSMLAIVMLVVIVIRAALFGDPVAGWPSTMCAILLIGGVQLLFLGVIGQYLAKAYLEAKRRPIYLVRESSDIDGQSRPR